VKNLTALKNTFKVSYKDMFVINEEMREELKNQMIMLISIDAAQLPIHVFKQLVEIIKAFSITDFLNNWPGLNEYFLTHLKTVEESQSKQGTE
jgi:hypothetical protein